MIRRTNALLLVLLMAAPSASGFHGEQGAGPTRPGIPSGPLVETRVIPIDQAQKEALAFVNETFNFGFDRLREAVAPLEALLPQQPVTLYRDGVGYNQTEADSATGVLGLWRHMGERAWSPARRAAHGGNWGFASADPVNVTYSLGVSSLLVTPELDLRTGFRLNERTNQVPGSITAPSQSPVPNSVPVHGPPWTDASNAAGDPLFVLEFYYRHNLGVDAPNGRDGVDLWILDAQGLASAQQAVSLGTPPTCSAGCTNVNGFAVGAYSHGNVAALGGPGFSGTRNWAKAVLDLTPWAEQRIWVAFHFASETAPISNYFAQSTYFGRTDWYGFQLDDLSLRAPAPPMNMQVHELDEPSRTLPGLGIALDQSDPVPVQTFVRNTGGAAFDVSVNVVLGDPANGPLPRDCREESVGRPNCVLGPFHLLPGDAKLINVTFDPIGRNASLTAQVRGVLVGPSGAAVPDSDARDDLSIHDFIVVRVREVRIAGVAREAPWVEPGAFFNLTATLRNNGSIAESVTVLARLLDVKEGHSPANGLLPSADQNRTYVLEPGEARPVRWSVITDRPGQYRLFVRTSDQPDFGATDLPEVQPPVSPPGDRRLSDGFGVGMGPPLAFLMDTSSSCNNHWTATASGETNLEGWTRWGNVSEAKGRGWDQWNCAPYQGRPLWYEGMDPDSRCEQLRCLPYSPTQTYKRNSDTVDAVLATPPIRVPRAPNPTLRLYHQYATEIKFTDAAIPEDGRTPDVSAMAVFGIAWVTAEECVQFDSEGFCSSWSNEVYLVPKGGYSTENNALPYENHRTFYRNWATYSQQSDSLNFCNQALSPPPGKTPPPNCGWWSPVGRLRGYREEQGRYPVGGIFPGSPWRLDSIPLTGSHPDQVDGHGRWQSSHEVDLAGKTVRFLFHLARDRDPGTDILDSSDPRNDPLRSLGWRIASIAIGEGDPVLDGGLDDFLLQTRTSEPEKIGLGPGMEVYLQVNVTNLGLQRVSAAKVRFEGVNSNATGTPTLCEGIIPVGAPLSPGDVASVSFSCHLQTDSEGALVTFTSRLVLPSGDDLPLNDAAVIGPIRVQSSPDAALRVVVTPVSASTGFVRNLRVSVENLGNVPLDSFTIQQSISRNGLPVRDNIWSFTGNVAVGQELLLSDPALHGSPPLGLADRFFAPPDPGDYALLVRLSGVPREADSLNNVVQVTFRALDTFYRDDFENPPTAPLPGVAQGAMALNGTATWQVVDDPLSNGRVLRAGDPATGEMPPLTGASATLPLFDLAGANTATLVIRHDYSLEPGYDAARVELSADAGATWEPLRPRGEGPNRAGPGAYPPTTLQGQNPLLDGRGPAVGSAFTGESWDDAAQSPRVVSEFDLTQAKTLQAEAVFKRFDLRDLASAPDSNVVDGHGDRFFTGVGWAPNEGKILDGWLVENITQNDPKPHSGSRMWWSGSTGEFTLDHVGYVETSLRVDLNLTESRSSDERATVAWYDWRAGWQDRELRGDRDGTGGLFHVFAETATGARSELAQKLVRREPGGWSLREADLSGFLGQHVVLELNYSSLYRARYDPNNPKVSTDDATAKNNEGWFVDDLSVTRYLGADGARTFLLPVLPLQDMENLVSLGCSGARLFAVQRGSGLGPKNDQQSSSCWRLVARGAARDGAWHLETMPGPDGLPLRAWRMSGRDAQGYPNQANTRLITPIIDLAKVAGISAQLQFDHRYQMESENQPGAVVPGDAGVVEVQEFDEATQQYGPWHMLYAGGSPPDLLAFDGRYDGRYVARVLSQSDFNKTGYNALYLKGGIFIAYNDPYPVGVGSPFDPIPGVCINCFHSGEGDYDSFPLTPAFSGDSKGWSRTNWDVSHLIGKKVRFAFHAWSNPQDTTAPDVQLEGWSVTNVALNGVVFQGRPVLLRLRVGTDGSLLDGHWDISNLEVSGTLASRKLAVLSLVPGQTIEWAENATPSIPFRLENQGTASRAGLAITARAWVDGTNAPVQVELEGPPLARIPSEQVTFPGAGVAWGPFALTPAGTKSGQLATAVRLVDAPLGAQVNVSLQILEDVGHDTETNGSLSHVPAFGRPSDETGGGTEVDWRVRREDQVVPVLAAAGPESTVPLQVKYDENGTIELLARVANQGTVEGRLNIAWRLDHGSSPIWSSFTESLLGPGQDQLVRAATSLPEGGRYTASLRATAPGAEDAAASVDFAFQATEVLGRERFNDSADPGGLPSANWSRAGNDGIARFRVDPSSGALVWGVSPGSLGGYCDLLNNCQDPGGFEGIAATPPFDLTLPLNRRAELVVRHAVSFALGKDGGRIEASLMQPSGGTWISRPCRSGADGQDWIPILPVSGFVHNGVTKSDPQAFRKNPLGSGTPVFQGIHGDLVQPVSTRYDLAAQRTWCPGGDTTTTPKVPLGGLPLLGGEVGLRFHVGIEGRETRPRRQGWLIDELQVQSSSVVIGPRGSDGALHLPIKRWVPKAFPFTVTNDGPAWKTFDVRVEAPESWACLEPRAVENCSKQGELSLAPGGTGTVWLGIRVPESAPLTKRTIALEVSSREAPNVLPVEDFLPVILDLQPLPKPNLAVELAVDDSGRIEAGTVVPLFAYVSNSGPLPSKSVPIRFDYIDQRTGLYRLIETLVVPALCAPGTDACAAQEERTLVAAEWAVPPPGDYTLRATVDADERMVERTRHDNVAWLNVTVKPLQLPDVEVETLVVDGVGPDGLIEENSLMTIRATVRNIGEVPIAGSQLRIIAGSVTITEANLPVLVRGAEFNVTAFKIATAGQDGRIVLKAVTVSAFAIESKVDNNEMRRVLTIRRHDLSLEGPSAPIQIEPGGSASTVLTVRNRGNGLELVTNRASGFPPSWQLRIVPEELAVPPRGMALAVVHFALPRDAEGGDWRADTVADAGLAKAKATLTVRVVAVLAPPGVALMDNRVGTGEVNIALRLTPASNVPQDVEVRPSPEGLLTFEPIRLNLGPVQDTTLMVPVTLPKSTPPGRTTAQLVVAALDDSWSREVLVELEILPTLRASFRVLQVSPWGSMGDGFQTAVVTLELTNEGNLALETILESDLGPRWLLGNVAPLRLAPGETGRSVVELRLDESYAVSGDRLVLRLVAAGSLFHTLAIPIPEIGSAPDLGLRSISVPPDAHAGAKMRVGFEVENRGTAASPPTDLYVYLDGRLVAVASVPALAVGRSFVGETEFFPGGGDHVITFIVDGRRQVWELHKDDNGRVVPLHVAGANGLERFWERLAQVFPAGGIVIGLGILAVLLVVVLRRRVR